jgi:hypothetical protein
MKALRTRWLFEAWECGPSSLSCHQNPAPRLPMIPAWARAVGPHSILEASVAPKMSLGPAPSSLLEPFPWIMEEGPLAMDIRDIWHTKAPNVR